MSKSESDEVVDLVRESAAEKWAMIHREGAEGKVTCAKIVIGQDSYMVRLRVNEWCDEPAIANSGPVEMYQRVVSGRASAKEIMSILRAGMKGAQRNVDDPPKVGPIIDRIMDDYPFSVAVSAAEVTLAAWLVGIDPPATEA